MDAFSRSQCLPNTRQDVLRSITDWLTTPSEYHNILWLHGLAGSGKSTMATTIAAYFRELGRLGAFMFFNRSDPLKSEPATVIRTLSYKLAQFDPAIKTAISTQIERDPSITEASISAQFDKLLLEPLRSLPALHTKGPIIIVIDAFDECGDSTSRKSLLALLAQELARFPPVFRFIITSRRLWDIEAAFSCRSNIIPRELDITSQSNASDILSYFRYHMSIFRDNKMYHLEYDWPGEEKIQALARSSAGLFIWASTSVNFISKGHHPDRRLNIILGAQSKSETDSALDALYSTALDADGKWDDAEVAEDFRTVLGTIVIGRIQLSDITLDRILGFGGPRSSTLILFRLRALLQWAPGKTVRFLHESFADYLTDVNRCGDRPWFIDIPVHHQNILLACFRVMKDGLKFNICGLTTSYVTNDDVPDVSRLTDEQIPTDLYYSCRFWAHHLLETPFQPNVIFHLADFLHLRLLYWLEVMSLTKEALVASQALSLAAEWARVST